MKLSKITNLSWNMLVHSKLRSWLTIIGIFIGVAAVVSIISLGEGLQQTVNSQIQGLGQDILTVTAGASRAFSGGGGGDSGASAAVTNPKQLTEKDVQALKLVPGIKAMSGVISGRTNVKYSGQTASLSIQGWDVSVIKEFITTTLESGRFINQGEVKTAVIGYRVANQIYKNPISVGQLITINEKPFRVVGILTSSAGISSSTDNSIYVPIKDAREVLTTSTLKSDEFGSINIKVVNPDDINATTDKIVTVISNSHHVLKEKADFSVSSAQALQSRFSSITAGITLFLGILAGVSLFVGGIGVANTMFTAVLEKTRDIGVMKAIGAKNRDIMLIFLINSGMLGLVGGILGVFFGAVIASLIPSLSGISLPGGRGGLVTSINFNLVFFSLLFSMLIGMLSGVLPAYQASKLKPVDALRSE